MCTEIFKIWKKSSSRWSRNSYFNPIANNHIIIDELSTYRKFHSRVKQQWTLCDCRLETWNWWKQLCPRSVRRLQACIWNDWLECTFEEIWKLQIKGTELAWSTDYLTARHQTTRFRKTVSSPPNYIRLPQGSVLRAYSHFSSMVWSPYCITKVQIDLCCGKRDLNELVKVIDGELSDFDKWLKSVTN